MRDNVQTYSLTAITDISPFLIKRVAMLLEKVVMSVTRDIIYKEGEHEDREDLKL